MSEFGAGIVMLWAGQKSNIPPGWAECNGALLSQSEYPKLYQAITESYGASPPSGQFYLPDLRGQFVRGVDDGSGRDPDTGSRVDMQNPSLPYSGVGSVQASAIIAHSHSYNQTVENGDKDGVIDNGKFYDMSDSPTYGTIGGDVSESETRPTNAYLYYIIKL